MPLLRRPLPSLLLLVLLASVSVAVVASPQQGKRKHDGDDQQGQHQPDTRTGQGQGHNDDAMSDSIRRVERATGGQVLSAERVPYEGRSVNRIKVVDGRGRVRVYTDDPVQPKGVQSKGVRSKSDQSTDDR